MGPAGADDRPQLTAAGGAGIEKRSVVLSGHRTSISLERAFWDALKEIAEMQGRSVNALVAEIDRARTGNLSSAVRLFVLRHVRDLP